MWHIFFCRCFYFGRQTIFRVALYIASNKFSIIFLLSFCAFLVWLIIYACGMAYKISLIYLSMPFQLLQQIWFFFCRSFGLVPVHSVKLCHALWLLFACLWGPALIIFLLCGAQPTVHYTCHGPITITAHSLRISSAPLWFSLIFLFFVLLFYINDYSVGFLFFLRSGLMRRNDYVLAFWVRFFVLSLSLILKSIVIVFVNYVLNSWLIEI